MTAIATPITLDAQLDDVQRRRERVMAQPPFPGRAAWIAELYHQEAQVWSLLFERSRSRLSWRAALAAEGYARHCAHVWLGRADAVGADFVWEPPGPEGGAA
jgi:hypothetical protein